jgi:hypothetical protein
MRLDGVEEIAVGLWRPPGDLGEVRGQSVDPSRHLMAISHIGHP